MSDKNEHITMIGEALDKSNGWSKGERIGAFAVGIFMDPILLVGHALNKIGVETEGLTDEDFTRV